VKNTGTSAIYSTIQSGYQAASTGQSLLIQTGDFTENLLLNRNIVSGLLGGYDSGFETDSGWTTINGNVTINSGTVNISKIIIATASTLALGDALDTTNLTWTTGGGVSWIAQTQTTHDGLDAAKSGTITDSSGISTVKTTVTTGAGTMSFWWKVSSEEDCGYLYFYLDSGQQASITGEVGWQQQIYTLSAGTHNLQWMYYKDSGCGDTGAGWVDQVVLPGI
jgi:hypothetical protein